MDEYQKSLLLNWVLLLIYSGITIYSIYSLSHSWPNKGSLSWFFPIFFCPPFLYHFITISYTLATKKSFYWKKWLRLITIFIGILLAGILLQYTQNSSLRKFNRAYFPMTQELKENMPMPCHGDYFQIPQVVIYNGSSHRMVTYEGKPIGELWYNQKRFVILFLAGSVDVDGSSLFYDSEAQKWQLFHNDNIKILDIFKRKLVNLTKCDAL